MNPAIGYRVWSIEELFGELRLASPYRYTQWIPRVPLTAECLGKASPEAIPKGHRQQPEVAPPLESCSCGIYAYHDAQRMRNTIGSGMVGGAVLCWGRITIHAEGIRTQVARPLALCMPTVALSESTRTSLQRLGAIYSVPLIEVSRIEVYAREFGESYDPLADPSTRSTAWGTRVKQSVREFFHW